MVPCLLKNQLTCCFTIYFCLTQKAINCATLLKYCKNDMQNNMKKLLLVLLFPAFVQAQKVVPAAKATTKTKVAPQQGFTITGSIAGVPDSTLVFLTHPSNPSNRITAGYVKNGKFTLKGQTPYADIYQLSITGYPNQ